MITLSAQLFVIAVSKDRAFRDRLGAAATQEDRSRIAREAGFAIDATDADAIREALRLEGFTDEASERLAGAAVGRYPFWASA
jgi:predicted ribosomally synthesized peptide with nif11-like leader